MKNTLFLLSLLTLFSSVSVRGQCLNLTLANLTYLITENYPTGDHNSVTASVDEWRVTCLAIGSRMGMYVQASYLANITVTSPNLGRTRVVGDTGCQGGNWVSTSLTDINDDDADFSMRLAATPRVDCRRCSDGLSSDPTNCIGCNQNCSFGTTFCTLFECCPYFSIGANTCTNNCGTNQHPNASTYVCECDDFYTGSDCSTCSIQCNNGGVANITACTCDCSTTSYTGLTCTEDVNECNSSSPSPCLHGGQCTNLIGGYECSCAPGYTGTDCETNIDDCHSNPCINGTCRDKVNGYTCQCTAGFTGSNCDTDINECSDAPCMNGGTCKNMINAFECTCVPGYTGSDCGDDIDECELGIEMCRNGGTCVNNRGGFDCQCRGPWGGGTCEECVLSEGCTRGSCGESVFTCSTCQNQYSLVNGSCVGCSVKDCRFCTTKDNCTTCNNNYVPSDGGTSCSPPIFTVPPTREPGTGRGLNTGAIIGIVIAFIVLLVIIAIIVAAAIIVLAKANKEKPPSYKVKTQKEEDKDIILTKITNI